MFAEVDSLDPVVPHGISILLEVHVLAVYLVGVDLQVVLLKPLMSCISTIRPRLAITDPSSCGPEASCLEKARRRPLHVDGNVWVGMQVGILIGVQGRLVSAFEQIRPVFVLVPLFLVDNRHKLVHDVVIKLVEVQASHLKPQLVDSLQVIE